MTVAAPSASDATAGRPSNTSDPVTYGTAMTCSVLPIVEAAAPRLGVLTVQEQEMAALAGYFAKQRVHHPHRLPVLLASRTIRHFGARWVPPKMVVEEHRPPHLERPALR